MKRSSLYRLGVTLPSKGTCYFLCGRQATMEKAGRSVCDACSTRIVGHEFPLRDAPWSGMDERTVAFQLEMPKPKMHSQW